MPERFDLPHEQTTGSRRGFDGHLLHIRIDDVVLPSGRKTVREVVEHPGSVAILPLTKSGRIILIRQWRHAIARPLLEIPAGTREQGEPAAETARRELIEETGYAAGSIAPITTIYPTAGYSNEEMTIYVASDCIVTQRPPHADEQTEVVLIDRDHIPKLLAPGGGIADAKSTIALLWLLARQDALG